MCLFVSDSNDFEWTLVFLKHIHIYIYTCKYKNSCISIYIYIVHIIIFENQQIDLCIQTFIISLKYINIYIYIQRNIHTYEQRILILLMCIHVYIHIIDIYIHIYIYIYWCGCHRVCNIYIYKLISCNMFFSKNDFKLKYILIYIIYIYIRIVRCRHFICKQIQSTWAGAVEKPKAKAAAGSITKKTYIKQMWS